MTPTQQVLLNAADLVERGWTQGTFARDAEGQQYKASAREAMCWCASGALTTMNETRPSSTHHVSTASSGVGSWYAGYIVNETKVQPGDRHSLLFTDVLIEDEDNYRFLTESSALIDGAELVWITEGRNPFEVFRDDRFLGNARLANCSKYLKQIPARKWLNEHCDPRTTVVYVGIDWSEQRRLADVRRGYAHPYDKPCIKRRCASLWDAQTGERLEGPGCANLLPHDEQWHVEAPLTEPPYIDKDGMIAALRALGVEPPRMYAQGFPHANCGGGCVRAGTGQFAILLEQNPERFAWWEEQEELTRVSLGKDVAILRDRRGGTTKPLTLRAFRERHQAEPEQTDLFDVGGCGCFVDGAA